MECMKIKAHTHKQIYNQREIPSFEWCCYKWDEGDEWAKPSAGERREEGNPERRKEGDGQGGTTRNSECKFKKMSLVKQYRQFSRQKKKTQNKNDFKNQEKLSLKLQTVLQEYHWTISYNEDFQIKWITTMNMCIWTKEAKKKRKKKILVISCTHNALGSILQTKSLYMPRKKYSTNLQIV